MRTADKHDSKIVTRLVKRDPKRAIEIGADLLPISTISRLAKLCPSHALRYAAKRLYEEANDTFWLCVEEAPIEALEFAKDYLNDRQKTWCLEYEDNLNNQEPFTKALPRIRRMSA